MRKIITLLLSLLFVLNAWSQQSQGDQIIGVYSVTQGDDHSKVRFTKIAPNTYKAQIFWLEKIKDANGNVRKDSKNPDVSKRNTPADQIILIDKISYINGEWTEGKIYDPTRGKYFTVNITFKDKATLAVKGSWGIFSQTVYWKKLAEK